MTSSLEGMTFGGKEPIDEEKKEKKLKIPSRQILYDLCLQYIEKIFQDQNHDVYVVCNIDNRKDILDIDSEEFKAFCRRHYEADYDRIQKIAIEMDMLQSEIDKLIKEGKDYSQLLSEKIELAKIFKKMMKHEKVPSKGELENMKEQIRALWYKERESRYLGKRVLWDKINNLAYYNLANNKGDIVKIWPDKDGKGWSLVSNSELLLFTKLPSHNEQVMPVQVSDPSRRYILEEMDGLTFRNPQHKLITEVYGISLFLDGIPHPVFLPNASERSGKTTLQTKFKSLADPREIHKMSYEETAASNLSKIDVDPKKEWDRALEWEHNWVTYGDNLSYIPTAVMDEICSLVQGGYNLSKKKNYTDKEQSTISIIRPIGFNSITNIMSVRPDANVRTFAPELLGRKNFADTEELWEQFYKKKPETLGYIFGILSKFLYLYPQIRSEISIMTEDGLTSFEKVGEIISRCLGNEPGVFQRAWVEYYAERVDNSIQQNTLAQLVIIYVRQSGKREFTAQPTDAYNQLRNIALGNGYDLKNDHSFPAHQNTLTPALKRVENILKKEGIEISTNEKEQGSRVIRFRNLNYQDGNRTDHSTEGPDLGQQALVAGTAPKGEVFICPFCDHQSPSFEESERHSIKSHSGKPFRVEVSNQKLFIEILNALIDSSDNEVEEKLLIDELVKTGRFDDKKAKEMISKFNREGRIYQRKANSWSKA
jgi:polyhydroxyalkanoate synthesis regulator phasin